MVHFLYCLKLSKISLTDLLNCIFCIHRLLGQTTRQPLNNFEPRKLENTCNFEGWGLTNFEGCWKQGVLPFIFEEKKRQFIQISLLVKNRLISEFCWPIIFHYRLHIQSITWTLQPQHFIVVKHYTNIKIVKDFFCWDSWFLRLFLSFRSETRILQE